MFRGLILSVALAFAATASAMDDIADSELQRAPSGGRIVALVDEAAKEGWGRSHPVLRAAALRAYEANSGEARAWYYLYRWAAMLATPERQAVNQWVAAVNEARVGHPNMADRYPMPPGSLSAHLSRDAQLFLLGSPAASEEFFTLLRPVDNPVAVLDILNVLHAANPGQFAEFPSLALAIAVVFDVPPPPIWPHGQVPAEVLPRQWPGPKEAFDFWVKLDRGNGTVHRLRRLPASELKFIVDTAAPFPELAWARQHVTLPPAEFAKAYDMVKYRQDRLQGNVFNWGGPKYDLATILKEGGICVDQAYFASTAGKARGIPTLLFRGAGLDGRHAWFGYLSAEGWKLDCGRYAEQQYVVGLAYDPQTWTDISDHELKFLSERFRALPLYRLSEVHTFFAQEYLRDGRPALAVKAAREAANRERRNLAAWETLAAAQLAAKDDARAVEATLREAAQAFARQPDLEAVFLRKLAASLRARGETSAAEFEERKIAAKNRGGRSDLSLQQAADTLQRSMRSDDLATQIRVYDQVLRNYGHGAGMDFFDKVVTPFVEHLKARNQVPAALQMLDRARRTLKVDAGSMLESEIKALDKKIRHPGGSP
ncbi:MAG TPA: hypothetical protein VEB66_00790 [Opitutaceae bacterium]|nr:hypothetical protein [Opitutaceae bacterium]